MPAEKIDPRILAAAQHSDILRHMIERGGPLTRERWISMAWGGHPPNHGRLSMRKRCQRLSANRSTTISPAVATRPYATLAA